MGKLRDVGTTLKKLYPNEKVVNLIEYILKQPIDSTSDRALEAAFLLAREMELNKYNYISARKHSYWFFETGSDLLISLETGLESTTFDDKEILIQLTFLYQYFKSKNLNPDEKMNDTYINFLMDPIKKLLVRLDSELQATEKVKPTYSALLRNFSQIPQDYYIKDNIDKKNPERNQYIKFFHSLHSTPLDAKEGEAPGIWSREYMIRYAIVLYTMADIESEYMIRSADNSALYRICKNVINIEKTSQVPIAEKLTYYTELLSFINKLDKPVIEEWEKNGLQNALVFLAEMKQKLGEQIFAITNPAESYNSDTTWGKIKGTTNYAAQFGISICLSKIGTEAYELGLGKNLISWTGGVLGYYAAGAVGFYMAGTPGYYAYAPIGGVVGKKVGGIVEEKLVPKSFANLAENVFARVGSLIGTTVNHVVTVTRSNPAALAKFQTVLEQAEEKQKKYTKIEWIRMIDDLPVELYPDSRKASIRHHVDPKDLKAPDEKVKATYQKMTC